MPRLFTIRRDGHGRLSTMAAPRGGDWLEEEMRALRLLGVDTLVSMLTESEARELDLLDEGASAEEAGLRFLALPIPDRDVPEPRAVCELAARLRDELEAGRGVAVHCRAGIGRSSLLAAIVLVLEGMPAAESWERIAFARGLQVPDTQAQRRLVDDLRFD